MNKETILLIALFLIGIATRTFLHVGDNVEFVTAISIVAGYFFRNKLSKYILPLSVIVITDLIIGNTNIFIFTWSAFLIAPLFARIIEDKDSLVIKTSKSLIGGIGFTLFFFLWTNFGVMLLGTMYSHDLSGLIQSYINALPFLANQLLGNLIIVPFMFALVSKYYYSSFTINWNKANNSLVK